MRANHKRRSSDVRLQILQGHSSGGIFDFSPEERPSHGSSNEDWSDSVPLNGDSAAMVHNLKGGPTLQGNCAIGTKLGRSV